MGNYKKEEITMDNTKHAQTILIELEEGTRNKHLDRAASWFNNILLTQSSYRQLLEDTIEKVEEPHIRQYLAEILERAVRHEEQVEAMFAAIGRKPSTLRKLVGEVAGKTRQALGDLIAVGGGAKGPWQDIHQLYLSNLNAMGAFAVGEQLGLALGLPQLVEIAFGIVAEKSTDQLILQEFVLEMCSYSILYKENP